MALVLIMLLCCTATAFAADIALDVGSAANITNNNNGGVTLDSINNQPGGPGV